MIDKLLLTNTFVNHFKKVRTREITETERRSFEAFKNGDESAFSQLFHSYYRVIAFYAYQRLNDMPLAEDIASDTFVKAWNQRTELGNMEHFLGFLHKTTRNACISYFRSLSPQRRMRKEASYLNEIQDNDPDREKIHAEMIDDIMHQIDEMPPISREILRLSLLENKDIAQIASELRISNNTASARKSRALGMLRSLLSGAGITF